MIGTLHRYVLRELLKTFVLTSVGMTLMFAMGGGLLNLIRVEQVSASDVAKLLLWFIPLVASFMLPIAALLSCALVYGRFAADNELDACKASGINILRLMASAVGLAFFVGGISFYLSNFKVPELFLHINEIVRRDLPDMLVTRLKDQGHIRPARDYVFCADHVRKLEPEEAGEILHENSANKPVVVLDGATFVQYKDEDPVQTGTARQIVLVFDRTQDPPTVFAKLLDVHAFYHSPPRFMTLEEWPLSFQMRDLPLGNRLDLKFVNLLELFRLQRNPASADIFKIRLERFRQKMAGLALVENFVSSLTRQGRATIVGKGSEMRIRLKGKGRCRPDLEGHQASIALEGDIRIDEVGPVRNRTYTAERAEISFQPNQDFVAVSIVLRGNVKLTEPDQVRDAVAQADGFPTTTLQVTLSNLSEQVRVSDEQILDPSIAMKIPKALQDERVDFANRIMNLRRDVTATIHANLSMSASTIVLVILATALGIVLRGGHALTAFGVAFIPTTVVILMIITGRNLGQHEATAMLGPIVMWGVLGLVAVLDGIVIFGFVRR